jgi:N-acetylglutamate synthase-like GNAT family acetyltransferase
VIYREAKPDDLLQIRELLRRNDLRPDGILEPRTKYWVVEERGSLIGAIGLELGETAVLVRSAVVELESRGKGIGRKLTFDALSWARSAGYAAAYCFSTDAGSYWLGLGFRPCPVYEVIAELKDAPQTRLFADLGWLPTEEAFKLSLSRAEA